MSISNYAELAMLNALRNTSFAVAATYLQVHTADPTDVGTTGVANGGARQSVSFSAASGGSMASSATVTWTNVTANETYTHWSLWDASTGGNCLWTGALASSASVTTGDTFQITSLTLTLD
jgi:hypothetical protein